MIINRCSFLDFSNLIFNFLGFHLRFTKKALIFSRINEFKQSNETKLDVSKDVQIVCDVDIKAIIKINFQFYSMSKGRQRVFVWIKLRI